MAEERAAGAIGLLVDQAWEAYAEGRYQQGIAAAAQAVEGAVQLDDPVLLVRALCAEACGLIIVGDSAAALARYTRVMGLAEDPAARSRLDHPSAAEPVASAFWGWAQSARYVTGIPLRELFRVLDAGERWLSATGHRDWRASILTERAMIHDRLGEMDAAVATAEEALAVKVQYPKAAGYGLNGIRYGYADILRNAGRAAEAAPHYQAILADPDAIPWERYVAHKGLASCALDAGEVATARREAHTAVLLAEPLGHEALCGSHGVLAEACRRNGDLDAAWQAATRHLEAARQIGGHYRQYYAARGAADIALDRSDLASARNLLSELDEHAEALDATAGTTAYTSETARRHQLLASALAGHHKSHQEAITNLTRAIDLDPDYSWAIAERGETYRLMGRHEEALADFTRAIDLDPSNAEIVARRGETYRLMGRHEEALADFTRAIDLDPDYSWAIASRGLAYQTMERYDEALADFTRAIDLDPSNAEIVARRGETYRLIERYEDALADLNRAIELDPDYSWAIASRGETYRLMGQYDQALADLNRAIELNPDYEWALASRGRTYRLKGQYDQALADLNRVIELDPSDDWSHYLRSLVCLGLGNMRQAVSDLQVAIELARKAVQVARTPSIDAYNLALYWAASGEFVRAREQFVSALRDCPIQWWVLAAIHDLRELTDTPGCDAGAICGLIEFLQ